MPWWAWLITAIGAVAVVSAAMLAYWNNAVKVVRYDYESQRLPKSFEGFSIAHISDFHNKNYGKGANRLVKKIIAENPNIIVISGDMIQSNRMKNAIALVEALVEIAPVYYASGNHERYVEKYPLFKEHMRACGVTVLEDETVELTRGGERIFIGGVIDPRFYMERGCEREDEFAKHVKMVVRDDGFNLLISHRPEFMGAYAEGGADLVLSGHAHAGQVRLPFIGAIFTPGERFHPKYVVGRYDKARTTMIVSGGLGSSSPILRVFNCPQLLIETLHSKAEADV